MSITTDLPAGITVEGEMERGQSMRLLPRVTVEQAMAIGAALGRQAVADAYRQGDDTFFELQDLTAALPTMWAWRQWHTCGG